MTSHYLLHKYTLHESYYEVYNEFRGNKRLYITVPVNLEALQLGFVKNTFLNNT